MSIVENLGPGPAPAPGARARTGPVLRETLARVVLPELRARAGRPLRVLYSACSSAAEVRELHALLDRETVAVLHGADLDHESARRAQEGAVQAACGTLPKLRFLPADLPADVSGVAPGCYDLVVHDRAHELSPQTMSATIARLRTYLRGRGAIALPGIADSVRAVAVERHGLEPWPAATSAVFHAEGPPPPPRIEDLLGRRVVAVCGMPRAGTTFLCDAVRTFGPLHGLFVTPRYWRSPIKLEEGARLNAVNDDPGSSAADLVPFMQEAAHWYRVPAELGLVCKLPQMVWRPDLLRCFSTVVMTVRPLSGWLDSAIRYRDTVMHAAGPAAWLPGPVQERVREHFDGHFLREYGQCTMEQVEQLDDVLDVDHEVFEYGNPERMRQSLDRMGLPGDEVLAAMWQGSRWQAPVSCR